MKRIYGYVIGILCILVLLTGCGSNKNNIDHHVYEYMKVTGDRVSNIMDNINYLFGNIIYVVGDNGKNYDPEILLEFDNDSGKCSKATLYLFYKMWGEPGDESLEDIAINEFNSKSDDDKKDFGKVNKGKVDDKISYIYVEINPESKLFNDNISNYILMNQDIDKYKKEAFYNKLDGLDSKLKSKEGKNYFYESILGTRLEWSDKEIKPF